ELPNRLAHRLPEVAVQVGGDEVRDDLGVGVRGEAPALGLEPLLQGEEVLDDAVVDKSDTVPGVDDRVGVALRRRTVGGPAGMAEPVAPPDGVLGELLLQAVELPLGLDGL